MMLPSRLVSSLKRIGMRTFWDFRGAQKLKYALNSPLDQKVRDTIALSTAMHRLEIWKTSFRRSSNGKTSDGTVFNPSDLAVEVSNGFSNAGYDCVVGGSMVITMFTLPMMTKDVDFNVNMSISDPDVKSKLTDICLKNNWVLRGVYKLKPNKRIMGIKEVSVGLACIVVNDIAVDVFLNDWYPTEYLHKHAQSVQMPTVPPSEVRLAPPEVIAFFKAVTFDETCIRAHKDAYHIQLLLSIPSLNQEWVKEQLVNHLGRSHANVVRWDGWVTEAAKAAATVIHISCASAL